MISLVRKTFALSFVFLLINNANSQSKFEKNLSLSRKNAHCIQSLVSEEFNDLEFLKDEIREKRIVCLGENNHWTKENNVLKLRLIKLLHNQMSFNVVLFESGSGNCGISNLSKSRMNPFELLYTSLLGAWRTEENCSLMVFMKQNSMSLAGMDPNFKARYPSKECYHFIFSPNTELAEIYFRLDSMNTYLHADMADLYHTKASKKEKIQRARKLNALSDSLKRRYHHILQTIVPQDINPEIQGKKAIMIIKLGLKNNIYDLSKDLTNFKDAESFWVTNSQRDSLMAANLTFLIDSVYTDEKIIVWAHNAHIKKSTETPSKKAAPLNSISFYLPERIKNEIFTIALFADYQKNKCSKNSIFNICREVNMGTFYLNTKLFLETPSLKASDYWVYSKCPECNKIEGVYQSLADRYDALIYIPNAQKSVLLNSDPYQSRMKE